MSPRALFPLLALSSAMLVACGGGGGASTGSTVGGSTTPAASTSSGTVTSFAPSASARSLTRQACLSRCPGATSGTVEVDNTRAYAVSSSSIVTVDDEDATPGDISQGMDVDVELKNDATEDLSGGSVAKLHIQSAVKGPVTSVSPLTVLEQPVVVDGSTVLEGVIANPDGSLQVSAGDILEVHGKRDDAGNIRAGYVRLRSDNPEYWRLTGTISNLTGTTSFNIGDQIVDIGTASVVGCGTGLADGKQVKVRAVSVNGFVPGAHLTTVNGITCRRGAHVPDGFEGDAVRTSYEGFISAIVVNDASEATSFTLNNQNVVIDAATTYKHGTLADIVAGARVEVYGTLDVASGSLTATEIRFRESRFRVEGTITAADISNGDTLSLFGLDIKKYVSLNDQDNVYGGISGTQQVRVDGFVNASGEMFARKVQVRQINAANVDVRAPIDVNSLNAPLFTVLGIKVDTSASSFGGETHHAGPAPVRTRSGGEHHDPHDDTGEHGDDHNEHATISDSTSFFSHAKGGQMVDVKGGTYDRATNTISGATIHLQD